MNLVGEGNRPIRHALVFSRSSRGYTYSVKLLRASWLGAVAVALARPDLVLRVLGLDLDLAVARGPVLVLVGQAIFICICCANVSAFEVVSAIVSVPLGAYRLLGLIVIVLCGVVGVIVAK